VGNEVVQSEHPLDNYFRELMRRRRKELLRKKKAALKTLQVGSVAIGFCTSWVSYCLLVLNLPILQSYALYARHKV
jgi:hypothetical protein